MKAIIAFVLAASLVVPVSAAARRKRNVIRVPGGTTIPALGLAIDASYDSRFDNFIPGYKVLHVALINTSFNIVYLNPERDRWRIKLAGSSRAVPAIHDLRKAAPRVWSELPGKTRELVGYPLIVPVGARQVIDLFVPDSVELADFVELDIYLRSLNTRLEIMTRQ